MLHLQNFSSYIRHLFIAKEILASTSFLIHNIFYLNNSYKLYKNLNFKLKNHLQNNVKKLLYFYEF